MNDPTKAEKKICEACGESFECGAKIAECWCFALELSPKTLDDLQKSYAKCLCRECLLDYEKAQIKN